MIDAHTGGGGHPGITDWAGWDVPGMWRMLADQDTGAQWRQVAGWRKTYELAGVHLTRLRGYRDRLAAAWPPERSPAARAYLDRLDQLIAGVAQTYDVASANYATAAAATSAIDAARADLQKIHDEYAPKRQARDVFDRQSESLASVGYQPWRKPPVSDTELAALNDRARIVMAGLSGELVQAQAQIRQPTTYNARIPIDKNDPDVYGSAGPPPIPSIVPVTTTSGAGRGKKLATSRPKPGAPAHLPTAGGGRASLGPVLGGVRAPTSQAPTAELTSPVIPRPGAATGPIGGQPVPPLSGMVPPAIGSGPVSPAPSSPLSDPSPPRPGSEPPPSGRGRFLPPGGVIGGTPPAAGAPPTGAPVAGTPVRRVNPVGGVLPTGAAGTGPAGRAGQRPLGNVGRPAFGQPPGVTVEWPAVPGRSNGGRDRDPDDPWAVDTGVPPVMLPPPPPGRIDPGPALGLDS
ncbi:hypothetical protein ACFFWC_06540 [Plantactinospora siamensis]|uniref:PPE family domain-containing protein n=1 Tax=Plantactinospora siamensis TaxID=555372 RepID=A0ABV6NWX5_9ACTN